MRRAASRRVRVPRDGRVRLLRAVRRRTRRAVRDAQRRSPTLRARPRVRQQIPGGPEEEAEEEERRGGRVRMQERRLRGVRLGRAGVQERVRAESRQRDRGASPQSRH